MKILFTHSYFYQFDPKQWANKTPYPPLGTIWAAAYMRSLGHLVALFDTNLLASINGLEDRLSTEKPDVLAIYDDGFNYLTKMCLTNMRLAAFEMIKMAKSQGIKVVVSSSDSTDRYQQYLDAGADAILLGEAEETLREVVTAWEQNESINAIVGLALPEKINQRRPVIRNLDMLPQPAWDLVDIDSYKAIWATGKYPFHLNLATTRGCPYKCNWCAKPIYGNRYNSRSPQKVVEEIAHVNQLFGATRFWMCDDIFGLKPGWVQEFNGLLKENNLKIQYKIQSRADLMLKENQIKDLAESGLYEVWIGAESGSQEILDAMDKGTTIEQIKESTQLLQSLGVRVAFFLQFGYLGETKAHIDKTVSLVKELKPDDIGISVSYPLPGTGFYETVKEQLGQKENWTDSDELAMMFKGSFNTKFYKTLQRCVHRMFRKQLALQFIKNGFKSNDPLAMRNLMLLPYNWLLEKYLHTQMSKMTNR
ncbi:MAG: B12-binding domain-containing radical SAM protein [Bacteroidetes bacterium]|nr:B12-binding domain-containing radical SAM protein [Bacteroidota bacterium]